MADKSDEKDVKKAEPDALEQLARFTWRTIRWLAGHTFRPGARREGWTWIHGANVDTRTVTRPHLWALPGWAKSGMRITTLAIGVGFATHPVATAAAIATTAAVIAGWKFWTGRRRVVRRRIS